VPDREEVEELLRAHRPPPDATAESVADLVERIAGEPELTRVDSVAALYGTSVRGLQRLFAEYVGVGPKWVIRRYRLHEITERLAAGGPVDWAGLAAELGYADQAHLVRDFRSMVGDPDLVRPALRPGGMNGSALKVRSGDAFRPSISRTLGRMVRSVRSGSGPTVRLACWAP
jgi:AraC-like DNA-binding protein